MPPQVVHDRQRGLLVFLRVYSGQLHAKDLLYNSTRDHKERPLQLLEVGTKTGGVTWCNG